MKNKNFRQENSNFRRTDSFFSFFKQKTETPTTAIVHKNQRTSGQQPTTTGTTATDPNNGTSQIAIEERNFPGRNLLNKCGTSSRRVV